MRQRINIDNGVTLVVDASATGKALLSIEHPGFASFGPFTMDADAACAAGFALSLEGKRLTRPDDVIPSAMALVG